MVTYDILILAIILALGFGASLGLLTASLCVAARDNKDEVDKDE
jgi:hypothetical protein